MNKHARVLNRDFNFIETVKNYEMFVEKAAEILNIMNLGKDYRKTGGSEIIKAKDLVFMKIEEEEISVSETGETALFLYFLITEDSFDEETGENIIEFRLPVKLEDELFFCDGWKKNFDINVDEIEYMDEPNFDGEPSDVQPSFDLDNIIVADLENDEEEE